MSVMRNSMIGLMDKFGIGDIVLPFLLVFTLVFAILEKTKVLGVEKVGNQIYTRKNLNAMMAFVIAFFVVMSNQLVKVIMQTTSNVVLLLLISILFLMLIGSLQSESEEGISLEGTKWKTLFEVLMFLGLVVVFLSALKTSSGQSWLEVLWSSSTGIVHSVLSTQVFEMVAFVGVIFGVLYYLIKGDTPRVPKKEKGSDDSNV